MHFRTARLDELEEIAALSPERDALLGRLARLWETGDASPETCIVLADGSRLLAAAPFWTLPSLPGEAMLLDLLADWKHSAGRSAAASLLEHCRLRLHRLGVKRMETRLFSDLTPHLYEKKNFYLDWGFPLVQEKESWQRSTRSLPPPSPKEGTLAWTPLSQCGEAAFRDRLLAVSCRTLDRYEAGQQECEGAQSHARDLFTALSDIDRRDELWCLADGPDGCPIGLAVRQCLDGAQGVVNYFGVLPGRRGEGWGAAILAASVRELAAQGMENAIVDADLVNLPLVRMLAHQGFVRQNHSWIFRRRTV